MNSDPFAPAGEKIGPRMDRRTALKWIMTAMASLPLLDRAALAQTAAAPAAKGYGMDPDCMKTYAPGELWPLTLTSGQRRTTTALCDLIIPADNHSPSASAVGVVDFLDEWISAPYPQSVQDRKKILAGLAWLDAQGTLRFGRPFTELDDAQKKKMCDEICYEPEAKPELAEAAQFFARFRDLTAGGFYTTPQGMSDLKYVGNVPLASFDGPPIEVLRKVGLA